MKVLQYIVVLQKESKRHILRKIKGYEVTEDEIVCCNPEKIYYFTKNVLKLYELAEEEVWVFATNSKSRVIGLFNVSHGTVNASLMNPREIFARALLVGAVNIIIVHNHPSGNPSPSMDDKLSTKRLVEVGKLVGIQVMDHVIVGEDRFYSLKAHDEM